MTRPNIPEQAAAYQIACSWLRQRELFPKDQFDVIVKRNNKHNGWSFWFIEIPMRSGYEFTVFVFDDGGVEFIPGM